jgi:uncharacterized protein YcbK (DUF882 family)
MQAILLSIVMLSTVHVISSRPRSPYPPILLYGPNVREHLTYRPFDDHGRPRKAAVKALTHLLRCRQTGKQHRVDPRLARALYKIGRHYAGKRIEIYSGYRPRAYCNRRHSRHLTASAIDFHVDGVPNEELIIWLRHTFHPAGVGYYPNGVHVHLDLDRSYDTFWVDRGDDQSHDDADQQAQAANGAGDAAAAPLDPPMDDPAFVD